MDSTLQGTLENGRLLSVNLLKSIAILMVLLVHTGQLFKGSSLYDFSFLGELGCQCFFMISGFTLCMSWDKRNVSTKQFYLRRLNTIAPGYYFDILLFLFLSLCIEKLDIPHYWIQQHSFWGVVSNLCLIHGVFPDYINTIVPGGWYIGTTILMYITFPYLKRSLEWVFRRSEMAVALLPWLLGIFVMILWMLTDQYFTDVSLGNNTFIYFSIFTQYPCFVLGATVYIYCRSGIYETQPVLDFSLFSLFTIITVILFYCDWKYAFSLVPLVAASCFACLLLALMKTVDTHGGNRGRVVLTLSSKISRVSYEMYLLHTLYAYYVIWYIRKALRHLWAIDFFESSIALLIAYMFVVVLSYYSGKMLHGFLQIIMKRISS